MRKKIAGKNRAILTIYWRFLNSAIIYVNPSLTNRMRCIKKKRQTKFDERFQRSQHDYDVCISLHLLTFLLLEFSIRKVPANTSNHSIPSPGVHWDQIQKDSLRAAIIYFAHFLAEYFTNNHSGISSMKWKRLAGNISRCLDKF